jgi:PAS domain S-box-containing protein
LQAGDAKHAYTWSVHEPKTGTGRSAWSDYGFALLVTTAALLIQLAMAPLVQSTPFLLFVAAVMLSGWKGGWGPGLLSTGMSAVLTNYFFLPPRFSFSLDPKDLFSIGLFLLISILVTLLNVRQHAARIDGEARSRAERLAATISDNATVGLVMMDARQHCTFMNPAAEKIFGFTFAEVRVMDRPLHDIIHHTRPDGSHFPMEECPIDRALPQKMQEQGEDVFVRKDGAFYPVAFTASPILEGGVPVGTVIEVRDTTEEKRAQARMRFLSEASRILVDSRDDPQETLQLVARLAASSVATYCLVDTVGADGGLQRVAAAHPEPAKEYLLRQAPKLSSHPDSLNPLVHVLQTGESKLITDFDDVARRRIARSDEHLALIRELDARSLMVVPMKAQGRVLGILIFAACPPSSGHQPFHRFDAEDLAMAEELARRAVAALENARLFNEAQEAVRLRDEFLSVASHELKTPLTSLRLQMELIHRTLDEDSRAKVGNRLAVADRQMRRLGALVESLLDVSRISTRRLALEVTDVDLTSVVREVVAHFEGQAAQVGSHLVVDAPSAVVGRWDRSRLEQVVMNLLSNAIKYGVGKPVHIHVESRGRSARLVVRDEGIGIEPEALGRIFEKFERAVSERHYGGLGLGLYMTRQIVEAMGGTVRAESTPGKGATLTVELPLSRPDVAPSPLESGGSTEMV